MPSLKNVAHLNIFLVKDALTRRAQIIKEDECNEPLDIPFVGRTKAQLYIKRAPGKYPKWAFIFEDAIDLNRIGRTTNASAALLIKESGRFFVLSFGPGGRFLIKNNVYEDRFGLIVALNSVDSQSFRCVDKQSLDSIESHTRIQSGHETTADQFGLDVEQDLLKAIVGAPKDSSLGTRMTGTDSLSVSVRMDLSDLPWLLKSYKEKFEQDLSATDYQWVNNISLVKTSSTIVEELNAKLLEKFANSDHQNLWLAIPEIINWESVKGFSYTNGKRTIYNDVSLEDFFTTINVDTSITLELLRSRRVLCMNEEHEVTFKSWSIYKCLYAEIDLNEGKYILNDGKWYKVGGDFVTKTNDDFRKIKISALELPEYCGGGEGKYNYDVAQNYPTTFALLDDKKKIFHGGGHGQIEVCDLFSSDKQLIHIKRYGKSSVLSHLFAQGFVSGRLLQLDSDFRNKVKKKLSSPFDELITVEKRPEDKEFSVIYAVISKSEGDDLDLPFFSRVNLNNTERTLSGFGYRVELLKIRVNPIYAKTKIGAPR
ncbi:MAG: hypothetical protein NPIRA01_37490 [Nitrospirales bacterium]|nr:MAG: hypothetical protein NPIRA01_37490 [Nitrospirales bacterium]